MHSEPPPRARGAREIAMKFQHAKIEISAEPEGSRGRAVRTLCEQTSGTGPPQARSERESSTPVFCPRALLRPRLAALRECRPRGAVGNGRQGCRKRSAEREVDPRGAGSRPPPVKFH